MAGVKGRSGTNRNKDKPYAEALRMELAAAGDDHKALRRVAAKHIALAEAGDMQAINSLADRLDGKPAQESTLTVEKHDRTDWTRAELVAFLDECRARGVGTPPAGERSDGPDSVH